MHATTFTVSGTTRVTSPKVETCDDHRQGMENDASEGTQIEGAICPSTDLCQDPNKLDRGRMTLVAIEQLSLLSSRAATSICRSLGKCVWASGVPPNGANSSAYRVPIYFEAMLRDSDFAGSMGAAAERDCDVIM